MRQHPLSHLAKGPSPLTQKSRKRGLIVSLAMSSVVLLQSKTSGRGGMGRRHDTARRGTQLFTACCVWQLAATCLCTSWARAYGLRRRGATHRMAFPSSKLIPKGRISQVWVGAVWCHFGCVTRTWQHGDMAMWRQDTKRQEPRRYCNKQTKGHLQPTTVRGIHVLSLQLHTCVPFPSRPSLPHPPIPPSSHSCSTPVPLCKLSLFLCVCVCVCHALLSKKSVHHYTCAR